MKSQFTPDFITELKENEIFVFGSNLEGMHGGGAARLAYDKFGAIWGCLLYTSPSPRDRTRSRMPSSA